MNHAPTGTVTFLFSDIESSTRMWQEHPESMAASLEVHDRVMREVFGDHHGHVFSTAGDSFAVAFAAASDAVAAALTAQLRLGATTWGDAPVRVRIGLHTGEAIERDRDYFGPALNRGARLMAAGHGGQVLVSAACAQVVGDRLPDRADLLDMGERRLKDLSRPEHVFQLVHPSLPHDFPRLRTLDVSPNNLPVPRTAFVGRGEEVEAVAGRLGDARLVTLTGVGGVGKTRIALQTGGDLTDRFPDGVWLVEFGAITDPGLVPKQVSVALDVQEQADRPVASTVLDALGGMGTLLVLDNCEHLIGGVAAFVDEVVRSCPGVRVLATSREPLGVPGEAVWPVMPLPLPGEDDDPGGAASVELFVDRARLADPRFSLTSDNVGACAEICRRLGGVPLAIELAAARVGVLPPAEIARRLDDQLSFLTTSPRTVEPRQQTLRAAIDWSYDLLGPDERRMLRHLSVFRGGFGLEAVEAMWSERGSGDGSALDLLSRLVAKSLVAPEARSRARFGLLETIRQYAWERLESDGEAEEAVAWHTRWFASWAATQGRLVSTPDQLDALHALEADHDNLRVLLDRSLSSGDLDPALRVAGDIGFFWWLHSHFGESGSWFRRLLDASEGSSDHVRAKLLIGAGEFRMSMSEHDAAEGLLTEAREIGARIGAERVEAWALAYLLTNDVFRMRVDDARAAGDAAMEVFERAGDPLGMGYVEFMRISLDYLEAWTAGDVRSIEEMRARLAPMVEASRGFGERNLLGHLVDLGGAMALDGGLVEEAGTLLAEAVDAFDTLGNQICLAHALDHAAMFATRTGRPGDAYALLAASTALRARIGVSARLLEQVAFDAAVATARDALDEAARREAWERGSAMGRAGTVGFARTVLTAGSDGR